MRKRTATVAKPAPTPRAGETRPAGAAASGGPVSNGRSVAEAAIRLRAYAKWEAAGRPDGDGVHFWLEAERELGQAQEGL
jgi:hypothetical protein